jgi:Family of unknown function (DUF5691)
MHELTAQIAAMRNRWITGGSAASAAPQAWSELAGLEARAGDDSELILLALAGQALSVAYLPASAIPIAQRADLPVLGAVILDAPRRALFRRARAQIDNTNEMLHLLLHLMADRGWSAHPADWFPRAANEGIPDIYAPWLAWIEGAAAHLAEEFPTPDTWHDWSWAERRIAVQALRRRDPAAGLVLIAAVAASETADHRVVLIAALASELNADDAAFLNTLAKDRSERVRQQAGQMLARLGQVRGAGEIEAELAGFLKVTEKGLLRRTKQISVGEVRTSAQAKRLQELFAQADFNALAAQLSMLPEALIDAWTYDGLEIWETAFITLALSAGGDTAAQRILNRTHEAKALPTEALTQIYAALPRAEHAVWINRALRYKSVPEFSSLRALSAGRPGLISRAGLETSASWKNFRAQVKAHAAESAARVDGVIGDKCQILGLVCDAEAAAFVMHALAAEGVTLADPCFDLLKFNQALTGSATA